MKKLHQWREQVFRRRIGGVRPTRKNWLESEKHHALALIQEQLKTHRRPKFKKLANVFNRRFNGTTQRRGEKQVFNGNAKNGGLLEEDRPAPWRTASALAGQTFKWNEYDDLIKKRDQERGTAVIQNDVVSSDDEDEIPDPVPPKLNSSHADINLRVGFKPGDPPPRNLALLSRLNFRLRTRFYLHHHRPKPKFPSPPASRESRQEQKTKPSKPMRKPMTTRRS